MLKKCLIGLAIYIVLAVSIMFGMIYLHNSKAEDNAWSFDSNLIVTKGSSLEGTYDQNDLTINRVTVNYKGEDFEYVQIEGLKNKQVEKDINADIKKNFFDCLDKLDNVTYAYVTTYGNFSNVLSVYCHSYCDTGNGGYGLEEDRYLNYNLKTGEQIKFKDLFVDNVNFAKVFNAAFVRETAINDYYDAMQAWYETNPDPEEWFEGYVANGSEEGSYAETQKYISSIDDIEFVFDERAVYVNRYDSEGWLYIRYDGIEDMICIFDRFKTAFSLFERDDIGVHGVFNFCSYYCEGKNDYFGFVSDNCFVDFAHAIGNEYYTDEEEPLDERYLKHYDTVLAKELDDIKTFINKAKSDKSHVYIYLGGLQGTICERSHYDEFEGLWLYDRSNMGTFTTYTTKYVLTKEEYEDHYKELLYNGYRRGSLSFIGEKRLEYKYDDEGNLLPDDNLTFNKNISAYNFVTNEELTDASQLFVEEFDYDEFMLGKYLYALNEYGFEYSEDQVRDDFKKCTIEFDAYGIQITDPNRPDLWAHVSFGDVEKTDLAIY